MACTDSRISSIVHLILFLPFPSIPSSLIFACIFIFINLNDLYIKLIVQVPVLLFWLLLTRFRLYYNKSIISRTALWHGRAILLIAAHPILHSCRGGKKRIGKSHLQKWWSTDNDHALPCMDARLRYKLDWSSTVSSSTRFVNLIL